MSATSTAKPTSWADEEYVERTLIPELIFVVGILQEGWLWVFSFVSSPIPTDPPLLPPIAAESAAPKEKVTVEIVEKNGKRVQITKKIRITKMHKKINKDAADRRKRWVKFGEAAGKPPGPEPGVTTTADIVEFAYSKKQKLAKAHEEQFAKEILSTALRKTAPSWAARRSALAAAGAGAPEGATAPPSDKYISPGARRLASGGKEEVSTIRVTNLSEEATEDDLAMLFKPFGPVQRIYLAKDYDTGESKGFAFINYIYREDAQQAMEKLHGTGFGYLILAIEWAKPSNK